MPFTAALLSVLYIKEWAQAKSNREPVRVNAHTAEFLQRELKNLGVYETFLAFGGLGVFLLLLPQKDEERTLRHLPGAFASGINEFHSVEEVAQGYIVCNRRHSVFTGYPLMQLMPVTVQSDERRFENAHALLSRLRRKHEHAMEKMSKRCFEINQRIRPK